MFLFLVGERGNEDIETEAKSTYLFIITLITNAPAPVPKIAPTIPEIKNLPGKSGNDKEPIIPNIKNKTTNTMAKARISPP